MSDPGVGITLMANREDEKKSGVPSISFGGGSAQSLRAAASAGAAAGAQAAVSAGGRGLALKIVALVAFMAAMAGSAYNVGLSLNPAKQKRGPTLDDYLAKPSADSVEALAQREAPPPTASMSVVRESLDDRTPEEKAADAAAAKAAADADAQAQAQAPDAAGQAAGAQAGPDAAHLGAYRSPTSKFGAAASAFLAGGSGLSGGVGFGGFEHPLTAPRMGSSRSMSRSVHATPTRVASAAPRVSSKLRGLAGRQLAHSSGLSQGAAAATGEASSAGAGAAFGAGDSGAAIGGAGASDTSGGGVIATNDGGPLNTQSNTAPAQSTGGAPTAAGKNATPWQGLLKIALALMAAAIVVILLASGLAKSLIGEGTAQAMAAVGIVLGAAIVTIGAMIMGMGGKTQGMILMGIGAVITTFAVLAMIGGGEGVQPAVQQKATVMAGELPKMG